MRYGEFVYAYLHAKLKHEADRAFMTTRQSTLEQQRAAAMQNFESDPKYLRLAPEAQKRAKASAEEQLGPRLEEALVPWEKGVKASIKNQFDQDMNKVYEVRARQMEQCHRTCEGWLGEEKMECMLGEIHKGDIAAAEACLF